MAHGRLGEALPKLTEADPDLADYLRFLDSPRTIRLVKAVNAIPGTLQTSSTALAIVRRCLPGATPQQQEGRAVRRLERERLVRECLDGGEMPMGIELYFGAVALQGAGSEQIRVIRQAVETPPSWLTVGILPDRLEALPVPWPAGADKGSLNLFYSIDEAAPRALTDDGRSLVPDTPEGQELVARLVETETSVEGLAMYDGDALAAIEQFAA